MALGLARPVVDLGLEPVRAVLAQAVAGDSREDLVREDLAARAELELAEEELVPVQAEVPLVPARAPVQAQAKEPQGNGCLLQRYCVEQ